MAAGARRRPVSLAVATALLATLIGGYAVPAEAAPVLAADTQRSGAGYAFGRNDFGQTNPASSATTTLGAVQLPAGGGGLLSDAVSFAAGDGFVVWADHKGAVWSLGDNSNGTAGNGTSGGVLRAPVQAGGFGGSGQPRAVKVSAYGKAVDVLDDSGGVWQWGQVVNNNSNLAIQSLPSKLPFPSGTTRIVDVSAGSTFSLALDDGGRAYSWGKNDRGQLGLSSTSTSPYPSRITGVPTLPAGAIASLEAGRDFGIYAQSTSTGVVVYTWGRNDSYQLGLGSTTDQKAPKLALTLTGGVKLLSLSGGGTHSLLLTNDGVVRSWGYNGVSTAKTPTVVADPAGALAGAHHPYQVAAGDGASFAASTDGTVASWGADTTGQLGRTTTGSVANPALVTIPGTTPASLVGVPATVMTRMGESYVVVDAEAMRSSPASPYDFGGYPTTPVSGQKPPSKTFTYTNVATKPLTFSSVTVDGANPGDFAVSASTCTGTVAVDGTCSLTITFTPTANGARSANVNMRFTNTQGGLPLQTFTTVTGNGYSSVQGLQGFTLDLAAGQPTTVSGPGNVINLRDLSPSLIPTSTPPTPDASLGRISLGRISLGRISLGRISLGRISLGRISLGRISLGRISLGRIPLMRQGGWAALLQDYPNLRNVPVSALTVNDLLDPAKNQPDTNVTTALPLDRVALGDLALGSSDLARLSLLSLLMGSTRLDQYSTMSWCNEFSALGDAGSCTDGDGLQRNLLSLDVQGAGVDRFTVGDKAWGTVVTDAQSPSSSPFDDTIFADLLLNPPATDPTTGAQNAAVTLTGTHVGAIPLTSLPNLGAVVDCSATDCSSIAGKTLADVPLLQTATFRDLGSALNPIKLAWLVEPFMDRSSFDWESLPVSSIPLQAYPNREVLQADVDVNCVQASGTSFGVKLPTGYRYVPGTTTLTRTRGTGTVPLADPTSDPTRGLVVSVPDSSFSSTGPISCTNDSAHLTVRLGVLPTATAGTYRATADVRTSTLAPLTATQATPVTVTGVNQPPDDTPDGPTAAADQLVLGAVTTPGKPVYVPFDAPAGKVVEVTVGGQTSDMDAVLYYPVGAPLDQALSGSTQPVAVPFGEASSVEPDALHPATTASGGALQDIPLLSDRPVAAVAATRGTDTEQLSAVARAGTNGSTRHVVAISGYNRGTGSFTVRIRLTDPPGLADCNSPAVPLGASAVSTTRSGTLPAAGDNTVVLVSTSRLIGRYGANAAASALASADSYVKGVVKDAAGNVVAGADSGVHGQVVQLDSSSAVRSAYAAWDASPCDPVAADGVVRAVNDFLAGLHLPSSVTDLVILGGDEQVPHARLEDHTRDANEREEAADLALNGGNPIASSLAAGYYLSDDPYGTTTPESVVGQLVYLPQLALGRVGESAADISAQLESFMRNAGVADPTTGSSTPRTAVAADYDFLTAGGNATAASLTSAGYAVDHSLTAPTLWDSTALNSAWLGKSPVPGVAALNMHYDQYRGLPAKGNASGSLSDLYTAQNVDAGPSLDRRVVFTVGCHSALDVPDSYAPGTAPVHDFAQAYGGKGLAVMVGNLGFGYADTSAVAYSAQQQAYFADGLAKKYDLGTALLEAKRQYVSRLAGLSAYDLKSAQESILWGLPQYRLTSAPAASPAGPATAAPRTDPRTGLPTTSLTVSSTTGTVSVPGRPVLHAGYAEVPQVAGATLHSVVPSGLTTGSVASNQTPTYARPGSDHGLDQQPQHSGVFPSTLGHVGTVLTGGATRSTLVVTPESYDYDTTNALCSTNQQYTCGTAILTRFSSTAWTAYYSSGTRTTPPTIGYVDATAIPASGSVPAVTSYAVDVSPAAGGSAVKRVYVLAQPTDGTATWRLTELENSSGRWLGGAAGTFGKFYVVAVDGDGNAAVSTNKGSGWAPHAPATSSASELTHLHVDPTTPASGWYSYAPVLTADSGYAILVDGQPFTSGSALASDGVHTVTLVRSDGSVVGSVAVLVDTFVPQVVLATSTPTPYQLNQPVTYTASALYGPSGGPVIASSGTLPTSKVGPGQTLSISATSTAGLTGTSSQPYAVTYGTGSSGFLSPVLKPDGINIVTRLLTYGFSFKLVDYYGNAVTKGDESGNTVTYTPISCPSSNSQIQLPKLSGATDQPVYSGSNGVWNWDLVMQDPGLNVAVCRVLTVTANDQSTQFNAVVQITP